MTDHALFGTDLHIATEVVPDEVRGHIGIIAETDPEPGLPVTFTSLGDGFLRLWSKRGASFTPKTARALGSALIRWAEREEKRTR